MKTLFIARRRRNFSFAFSFYCLAIGFAASNFASAQTGTIGTSTFSTTFSNMFGTYCEAQRSHKVQYLYLGSELVAAGAYTSGVSLTSIAFNCSSVPNYPLVNWTIKISQSNSVANLNSVYNGTFTTVYSVPAHTPVAGGWNTYVLPTPYYWQGVGYNLVVEVCNDLTVPSASVSGANQFTTANFTAVRYIADNVTSQCGTTPVSVSTSRANLQFGYYPVNSCNLTPAVPTITSSATALCPGANFILSASGYTSVYGLTYQWQSSIACSGTWGNISGATNASAVSLTQVAATCYRLYTVCTASGFSSVSNVVNVTMNSAVNCYSLNYASSTNDEDIFNVTISSVSVLNQSSTCLTTGGTGSILNRYSNYTGVTPPNLAQGGTATLSIQVGTCGTNNANGVQLFIDYNQDGDFADPGERVYSSPASTVGAHTEVGSFLIPAVATLGLTGMRAVCVQGVFPNGLNYATTTYTYGETEDFKCNIFPVAACTGTPVAGIAISSLSTACVNNCFQLSASGLSISPGIIYQWQYNPNGAGWSNIPGSLVVCGGSVTSPYVSVSNQTVATQYRILSTCTNSFLSNVSTNATVGQNAPTNCYCIPSYSIGNGGASGDFINSISLNGFSNLTGPNAPAPDYYIFNNISLTNANTGDTYTATVGVGPSHSEYVKAWIDYNTDGDFLDAGESLGEVLVAAGGTGNITFTIPVTATLGIARIRFRCNRTTSNQSPCINYVYGETEDYGITIQSSPLCVGTPTGGTTNSSDPTPCVGIPITLSVTGASTGFSGLTYQWQEAATCAGPWTNILGATSINYNYTFCSAVSKAFRRTIICGANSSNSTCLLLTATLCYCQPTYTTGTGTGFYISRVQINNGGLDNISGASVSPFYTDNICSVPPAVLMVGAPYWINVSTGSNASQHVNAVWIDFNQDGDFIDVGELWSSNTWQALGAGSASHHFGTISVTALLGTTRMRVRTSSALVALDPCLSTAPNYIYGETEDYAISIVPCACVNPTQNCQITIIPPVTVSNDLIQVTSTCGNATITGYEIDWTAPYDFLPPNNTITNYTGSFVANINAGIPQGFVYIRAKYQNGCCPVSYSNAAFLTLDCAPPYTTANGDYITNVKLGTSGNIINNTSTFNSNYSSYQNFLSLDTFIVHRGVAMPVQVCVTSTFNEFVRIWIDENGDGYFSTSESVYTGFGVGCIPWGSLTIPIGSGYIGLAKMRVVCQYGTAPNIDACYSPFTGTLDGEIEEYMLNIQAFQPITVNPTSAICAGQTAVLNATGPAGTTNFQWTPTNGVNGVIMNPANGQSATVTVQTINPSALLFTVNGTLASGNCGIATIPVSTIPVYSVVTPSSVLVCSGGVTTLTATGVNGNAQWQIATSNSGPWSDILGSSNGSSYTTSLANTLTNKYYRVQYITSCLTVYSNTVYVSVATSPIVTFTNGTSTSVTVNWTPSIGGCATVSWTGAGTGSISFATSPVIITGLTSGVPLNVTVSLTCVTCGGVNPGTATYNMPCTAPASPTTSNITSSAFTLNWLGTGTFKIFYKAIFVSNWSSVIVAGNTYTVTGALSNMLYQCYIQKQNCPVAGTNSSPSPTISFYTLPGTSTCATPTVTATANCGNAITIGLSGSPTGNYKVYLNKTFPAPMSVVSFNVTGSSFVYNAAGSVFGTNWNIFAQSICTGNIYSLYSTPVTVSVAPICLNINPAPMYGQITCTAFTASWNQVMCGASAAISYRVFVSDVVSGIWVSYNTTNFYKTITGLLPGHSYNFYVRAVGCNFTLGVASTMQTLSTLPVAVCKLEEVYSAEENITSNQNQWDEKIIYPNPADHFFYVEQNFNNDLLNEECTILMYDVLGRTVLIQSSKIENGKLKTIVDLPEAISSGIYFVSMRNSFSHSVQRLIISK